MRKMRRPIADLFYENAEKMPDKTAIWCDGETCTYRELRKLVNCYSNLLLNKGVASGEHVGIPMISNINSAALLMAANNIGMGMVPINPSTPIHFLRTIFKSGDVKHLIAHKSFLQKMEREGGIELSGITVCLDGDIEGAIPLTEAAHQEDKRPQCPEVTGDETLVLVMTSGSTGTPKPIDLSQRCKYMRALTHKELYHLTSEDVIMAATPLFHTLAIRLVLLPLQIGGTSVLLPRFAPSIWVKCIQEQKVSFTIAVSSQLSQVSDYLEQIKIPEMKNLRCLVSSSSWLEPMVKDKLIKFLKCEFHEIYGTSETSSPTDIDFRESKTKVHSVGKCVPGARIRIRCKDGTEAKIGEIGEITTASSQHFKGYYNLPELTEKSYDGEFFRTGDLGYVDEDGYLYYSGRIKEIIECGGINVYPQDIEAVLLKHPSVRECAAFPYKDIKLGEVIAVAVSAKADTNLTKREIAIYCARNLADFQQPRYIFIVEEIPKNAMGKISRVYLSQYFA